MNRVRKLGRTITTNKRHERRFNHRHEAELYKRFSKKELVVMCRDAGLGTLGDKRSLAKRLHDYLMVQDELEFEQAMEEGEKTLKAYSSTAGNEQTNTEQTNER